MKLHKILFLIICILLVIVTYDIGATNGKKVKKKKKKKKMDDLGLGGTAPVLVCTACTRVIGRIGVDVTKRLEKNDQWVALNSTFGLHLVRLTERNRGGAAPLNDVASSVQKDWLLEQRKTVVNKALDSLRRRYETTP
mgnify:CR=1 FL=1